MVRIIVRREVRVQCSDWIEKRMCAAASRADIAAERRELSRLTGPSGTAVANLAVSLDGDGGCESHPCVLGSSRCSITALVRCRCSFASGVSSPGRYMSGSVGEEVVCGRCRPSGCTVRSSRGRSRAPTAWSTDDFGEGATTMRCGDRPWGRLDADLRHGPTWCGTCEWTPYDGAC